MATLLKYAFIQIVSCSAFSSFTCAALGLGVSFSSSAVRTRVIFDLYTAKPLKLIFYRRCGIGLHSSLEGKSKVVTYWYLNIPSSLCKLYRGGLFNRGHGAGGSLRQGFEVGRSLCQGRGIGRGGTGLFSISRRSSSM